MNTQSQTSISLDTVIRFLKVIMEKNPDNYRINVGTIVVEVLTLKLMLALLKSGHADFLLLSDDQLKNWWGRVYTNACKNIDVIKQKKEQYDLRLSAYNKLTAHERKLLGIKMPTKSVQIQNFEFLFSMDAKEKQIV